MHYADICPPTVVRQRQQAGLRSAASSILITWFEDNADRQRAITAMEAVATPLAADCDLSVIDLFCTAVASYAHTLDADQKVVIRVAYLHVPYRINWAFASLNRAAGPREYHLYLATLRESGALKALAAKFAETKSGNDVTLLLMSAASPDGPGRPIAASLAQLFMMRGMK